MVHLHASPSIGKRLRAPLSVLTFLRALSCDVSSMLSTLWLLVHARSADANYLYPHTRPLCHRCFAFEREPMPVSILLSELVQLSTNSFCHQISGIVGRIMVRYNKTLSDAEHTCCLLVTWEHYQFIKHMLSRLWRAWACSCRYFSTNIS